MGKWSKIMKKHHKFHHKHHKHHKHDGFDSSDDSSCDGFNPKMHPKFKKHWKKWHKYGHMMKHHMVGDDTKSACTLCHHAFKPFVDLEVLECGHVYHKNCLKQLFAICLNDGQNPIVCCTKCQQQVTQNLVDAFVARLEIVVDEGNDNRMQSEDAPMTTHVQLVQQID